MRVLLDTHTFLWWNANDPQLSMLARQIIGDSTNTLYVSVACAWEIAIKAQTGKLVLPQPPPVYVASRLKTNSMKPLPVRLDHALHVFTLPMHHRDPFDRIIIAQSQLENLPILTIDPLITQYAVQTLW